MSERKVVVELVLQQGNALSNLGKLEIETKEYQRELRLLNAEILKNGTATKQQQLRVAELSIAIRRNQTVVRELKNDLSGATAAGLRFRDKMAEASRAGLGAFGLQAVGIAAVTTAAIQAVKELVVLAAQIEQIDARNQAIAGESLPAFTAAAEANAEAIGLTRREYVSLAATQQLRLKNLGLEGAVTERLAIQTVETAEALSDFSAGTLTTEEAAKLLNDALTGQTRGLKELGINVKFSEEELGALASQIQQTEGVTHEQAVALANLQLAFEKTQPYLDKFAEGTNDLDRVQDSANAKLKEAKEALAEGLTPALVAATEAQAGFIKSFADFTEESSGFRKFLAIITVGMTEVGLAGAKGIGAIGEEAEKAAPAVGALATEVEKLPDATGAFEVIATRTRKISELREEVKKLREDRDKLKTTDVAGLKANEEAIISLEKQIAATDIATKSTTGRTKAVKELTEAQKEALAIAKEFDKLASAQSDTGKDAIFKPLQSLVVSEDNPEVTGREAVNDLLNNKYNEDLKNYENYIGSKEDLNMVALEASGMLAGSLAGLFDQQSEEFKAFAVVEALISTYLGAARALADKTIPNTFARIAAASAVVLTGLGAVRRIQGFEEGGYTDRASSNKKAVGVVHANEYVVPAPILRSPRGKTLVDELEAMRLRHPVRHEGPFIGGGGTGNFVKFTRGQGIQTQGTGVTAAMVASSDLSRALLNMPPPVLHVTDLNRVQGGMKATRVAASL